MTRASQGIKSEVTSHESTALLIINLQHCVKLGACTPCLQKLCKFVFQNFFKFPPILIIFGKNGKEAKIMRGALFHLT